MSATWKRRAWTAGLTVVGLGVAVAAEAHDFWLVPNAFEVDEGQELQVSGRTSSSFPHSLSAVTPDRVADARLLHPSGTTQIDQVDVAGEHLRLRVRPQGAGSHLIAVAIHPRLVPESAESFRNYLVLEGAPEALARYEREGILPTDSIVRRYAKYAKTLVSVGQARGDSTWARQAGHPLEFVLLDDPSGAPASLRFQLLLGGEPVTGQPVHAGHALTGNDTEPASDGTIMTDQNGVVRVATTAEGIWNVRTLVIVPAPQGSGADWDVHWATFVWQKRVGGE